MALMQLVDRPAAAAEGAEAADEGKAAAKKGKAKAKTAAKPRARKAAAA
jgi:hypothetical protein